MTGSWEAILESALRLPEAERAALAVRLIDSLDPGADEDVEAAWGEEIRRRVDDLTQGRVQPIPWAEVWRRLRDDPGAEGG
jgi:putative addiction module component (TIGR02574 family)